MARAAIVWRDGENLGAVALPAESEVLIGRAPEAAVRIENRLVSRRQALVRCRDGGYEIEQVGASNPTQVNGIALNGVMPLRDRAAIVIAGVRLTFHDLDAVVAGDTARCGYCGRLARAGALACWYCGTTLDNADTAAGEAALPAFRLIDDADRGWQPQTDGSFGLNADGTPTDPAIRPSRPAFAVRAAPHGATFERCAGDAPATVNGEPLAEPVHLKTGDVIVVGDRRYVAIVR